MKQLPGELSISKTSSTHRDDFVRIRLCDKSSGCVMVDIEVSLSNFAEVLFGKFATDCFFALVAVDKAGLLCEFKHELVPREDGKTIDQLLSRFEVGGWQARRQDMDNHHCFVGDSARVLFTRFVDDATERDTDANH